LNQRLVQKKGRPKPPLFILTKGIYSVTFYRKADTEEVIGTLHHVIINGWFNLED